MTTDGRASQAESAAADREIVLSRVIDAPRELVFEAFTEVRHLSQWWGPKGFTTTTRSFEFRVGGDWDFVMHGPDGTDYREWITWTEIVPPERIAMLHGEFRGDPNAFESVLTFESVGESTRVEMLAVFPTAELRDEAIERHGAIEGGRQTLGNLAAYVAEEGSVGLMPGTVFFSVSMSLDGFIAPESPEELMGQQWMELQQWAFRQRFFRENLKLGKGGEEGRDNDIAQETFERTGASVMGKRIFDAGERMWPEEPPFHTPVFVVTHEERDPWERRGGTTFHFVNDGIHSALDRAREAAGNRDVRIAGGGETIVQYLNAGLVNEFHIALSPVLFGSGVRLFEGVDAGRWALDLVDAEPSPHTTHLRYAVRAR
ncbi:SRPBCC domain-containing protein [Agromyces laixinhei]|uniref:SRPBCC domain-containing protein n=1 Tax=Agromyces laixinhei TaxID=2585717 RepID=UPI0018DDB280|nr:SRPBCC domain-containing protein [Agromyces laixinhei]